MIGYKAVVNRKIHRIVFRCRALRTFTHIGMSEYCCPVLDKSAN